MRFGISLFTLETLEKRREKKLAENQDFICPTVTQLRAPFTDDAHYILALV